MIPTAVVLLAVLASLAVGSEALAAREVFLALFVDDGGRARVIVHELRVPRTLLAASVGAALGIAGALMQSLTRNPLADPGILGVNAGAAAGVAGAVVLLGLRDYSSYVWFAFLGAGVTAVLVYAIGTAGASPVRLALAGTAIGAALTAATQSLVLLRPDAFDEFRFWAVGDLAGRDPAVVRTMIPFLLVGLVLALAVASPLNTLVLGDDVSRALGSRAGATRAVVALAVLLLSGAATAAAGPIAFVGLVVPHIARSLLGSDHRWSLPGAGLLGAALVLVADVLGRVVLPHGELQVGLVVTVVGAPFFIALVRHRRMPRL
ncbi:FecCD family ABC transporter permease [Actinoalloteichus caeruleus]|uniref:Iron complex transport system permease protein n=1 Tax=Actinoalloteichus caeruleus DSM 43889 TaxID=1120930 RepID=A0ABT1JGJ3_ACTCY|nr:iron ABC transporter permease [Actinoalloteichus caeruleus]MCP2331630.1 iron complex transport system permease protein [Actinoalloteichus caeruleus DSM 43889]